MTNTQEQVAAAQMLARDTTLRLLRQSNMPTLHYGKIKAVEIAGTAQGEVFIRQKGKRGTGFIESLVGGRGTGKTQLACVLIEDYCKNQCSAIYVTATEFFLEIKHRHNPEDDEETQKEYMDKMASKKLLVIDEVSRRAQTEFENNMLFELINRRYSNRVDTLLIDNMRPEDFKKSIDPSIISRMVETGGIISCEGWTNHRTSKA